MIVAVDGPSGVGKSTVTHEVARRLGLSMLDTGALYRAAALLALEAGIPFEDGPRVAELLPSVELAFRIVDGQSHLFVGDRDVAQAIRTPQISDGASKVSAQPEVRAALLDLQRRLGRRFDCIVEGRDIGTVVFPDARHKFFLTASDEARTRRRQLQYAQQGKQVSQQELRKEVAERDRRDTSRQVAPLVPASDAIVIDTTDLTFEQVVERIVGIVSGG
ncbi:MAG: (d)CMP kinase [Bradymonadales bacterium]|nr:(d)CMP kinase [Bradymonadales bacterium]